MSIFKRRSTKSDASSGKEAIKSAAKRAEQVNSEDITSSIRAELALEFDEIIDDFDDVVELKDTVTSETTNGIDDIADEPEIEAEIKIPEPEAELEANDVEGMLASKDTDLQRVADKPKSKHVRTIDEILDTKPETIAKSRPDLTPEVIDMDTETVLPVVTFAKENAPDPASDIYDGPPTPQRTNMNLSELRLDVVRISADIESGEELYRRAQQRVESLMTFVDQAEVTGALLNKLEPENRRIKSRNRSLQSEVIAQTQRLETLEDELEEQRRIASKARIKVDTLKSQLADAHEAIRERNAEIETFKSNQNDLRVQGERIKTSLDIETRENITMRERLKDLSEQVETLNLDRIDALKAAEALKLDLDDQNRATEQLQVEISETRLELGRTRVENENMRDELVEIQEKVAQFKSHQELVLLRRDDKIAKLESIVADFKEKMQHKEAVVQSAVTDVSEMRRASTASVIEREKLEKIIEEQKHQLQAAKERILLSKKEADSLDKRYRDAAAELLKIQAAAQSSENPDIFPTMKEQQIARQKELDADRGLELDRQQAENLERITKVYDREPDDIRSRYIDDPYISPRQSESG